MKNYQVSARKINVYEVTLYGDICGIVDRFTLTGRSLCDLKGLLRSYIAYRGYGNRVGNVMVLAHVGSSAKDDKLYFAPSLKLNFTLK